MKSHASLLSLVTISEEDEEKVIFVYLKELVEIAPQSIYWYKNKGEGGNTEFIWTEKKLKQWLVIGEDQEIENLWKELITNNELQYSWGNTSRKFTIAPLSKKVTGNNFVSIDGVCSCERNDYPIEYTYTSLNLDISFLFDEQSNCEFISGYRYHEKIKPIVPLGLLGEGSFYRFIKEGVGAVYKQRGIYYTLRGDREGLAKGVDPSSFVGFLQATKSFRSHHQICIRRIDGEVIIGTGNIDEETGQWFVALTEPASRGQFLIQNKETGEFYCGEKFYLIKDIKIETQIVNTVLVDLYGREINLGNNQSKSPYSSSFSFIWDATVSPDSKQGEIELSDKLTNILLTLGKKIVFNDPYFWGDFEESDQFKATTKSQFIFLNSLITAIAKGGIEEVFIVGYWRRAKNYINGDQISFEKKYRALYRLIKNTFKGVNCFKLNKFNIILSEEPFHDRYWLSLENDTIYHVSNSINGAFESGELKITVLDSIESIKIKPRVVGRLKKGNNIEVSA